MATTKANQPQPDETDAQILILRDPETGQFGAVGEAGEEERANAKKEAKLRKAVFEHRAEGAKNRAGLLPRSITAALAGGTVNLMLAKLLQEEIVPGSAKEAADVAKVAHEIYMKHAGVANPKDLSPAERDARRDEVSVLERALAERAKSATAALGGALPKGVTPEDAGEEPDQWEHEVPAVD